MEQHVRDELSAYLDGELEPAERALVQSHLTGCAACRASVAELSATARVIAALPPQAPSRRLVPSLAPRFAWIRPLRSASAVLAGAFLFVFLASATLDSGWRMGGGRTGGAVTTAAQPARKMDASGPAGAVGPAGSSGRLAPVTAPAPSAASQEATRSSAFASPTAADRARTDGAPASEALTAAPEPLRIGPSPWLWLGLAVLCGLLAFAAHRRLRVP